MDGHLKEFTVPKHYKLLSLFTISCLPTTREKLPIYCDRYQALQSSKCYMNSGSNAVVIGAKVSLWLSFGTAQGTGGEVVESG